MNTQDTDEDEGGDASLVLPDLELVRASIGARLRSHRIHRNLTGIALARQAGISGAMLSKIESGERMPSVPVLAALAAALGVEIGDLFGSTAQMSEPVLVPAGVSQEDRRHEDDKRLLIRQVGVVELPDVQVRLLVMTAPQGAGVTKPIQFDGFWIDHVLQGEIVMNIGGRDYHLRQGDTLSYRGEVPHYVKAIPVGPAVVYAVQGWLNTSAINRTKLDGALLAPGQR